MENNETYNWAPNDPGKKKNKPSMKQRSVLRAIGNIYHPPVIADPYGYMKNLRK